MRVALIGVGGGGAAVVDRYLANASDDGVVRDSLAIDTDALAIAGLDRIPEERRIVIGDGEGTGGDVERGASILRSAGAELRPAVEAIPVESVDAVVVVAGLGGGTGGGCGPLLARSIAEGIDTPVLGLALLPTDAEGDRALDNAARCLEPFYDNTAGLVVFDGNAFAERSPDDRAGELVTRIAPLLSAGNDDPGARRAILETLAGGVATVGYAADEFDPGGGGVLSRLGGGNATADPEAVLDLVQAATLGDLTLLANCASADRTLLVAVGPEAGLPEDGIARGREWLADHVRSDRVAAGVLHRKGARREVVTVFGGVTDAPRVDRLRKRTRTAGDTGAGDTGDDDGRRPEASTNPEEQSEDGTDPDPGTGETDAGEETERSDPRAGGASVDTASEAEPGTDPEDPTDGESVPAGDSDGDATDGDGTPDVAGRVDADPGAADAHESEAAPGSEASDAPEADEVDRRPGDGSDHDAGDVDRTGSEDEPGAEAEAETADEPGAEAEAETDPETAGDDRAESTVPAVTSGDVPELLVEEGAVVGIDPHGDARVAVAALEGPLTADVVDRLLPTMAEADAQAVLVAGDVSRRAGRKLAAAGLSAITVAADDRFPAVAEAVGARPAVDPHHVSLDDLGLVGGIRVGSPSGDLALVAFDAEGRQAASTTRATAIDVDPVTEPSTAAGSDRETDTAGGSHEEDDTAGGSDDEDDTASGSDDESDTPAGSGPDGTAAGTAVESPAGADRDGAGGPADGRTAPSFDHRRLFDTYPDRRPPASTPPVPAVDLTRGEVELGTWIGETERTETRLATTADRDRVVVKFPNLGDDGETIETALGTLEDWRSIGDHDSVAAVLDWGSEPRPWFGVEYLDGGPLDERVGSVPAAEGVWIAARLAAALERAHETGVTHLAIHPGNVGFRTTPEGRFDVPKITDWGIAKIAYERTGVLDGFPAEYSAPEQLDAEGAPGPPTDVYQLGVVCYELFTGERPFEGLATGVIGQVLNDDPDRITERDPSLPAPLADVVDWTLAKRPEDRPTAAELRAALADLLPPE